MDDSPYCSVQEDVPGVLLAHAIPKAMALAAACLVLLAVL